MDISNLTQTQDLKVLYPDGTQSDLVLKLCGMDSKAARAAERRVAQYMIDAKDKMEVATIEKLNAELMAACIVDWSGLTKNGEPVPYSSTMALELMSDPVTSFVREQVEAFVSKRAHFFRSGKEAA